LVPCCNLLWRGHVLGHLEREGLALLVIHAGSLAVGIRRDCKLWVRERKPNALHT
jgi:hypothetical protein